MVSCSSPYAKDMRNTTDSGAIWQYGPWKVQPYYLCAFYFEQWVGFFHAKAIRYRLFREPEVRIFISYCG